MRVRFDQRLVEENGGVAGAVGAGIAQLVPQRGPDDERDELLRLTPGLLADVVVHGDVPTVEIVFLGADPNMVSYIDKVGEVGCGAPDAVDHLGHPMIGAVPVGLRCRLVEESADVTQVLAEPGAHRGMALLRVDAQPVPVIGER